MRIGLVYCFLLLLASCGKESSDNNSSGKSGSPANPNSSCNIVIYNDDLPAVIATKAFRMQTECKVRNEVDLESMLSY